MMNSWNGIGNLTRDPELKYSTSGVAFAKCGIAVQRRFNKDETDFINFTVFGRGAEIFCEYVGKGSKVGIEGRIQTGRFEDKDGKMVYTTDVIAENFTFLDSKKDSVQSGSPEKESPFDNAPDISDENLPF